MLLETAPYGNHRQHQQGDKGQNLSLARPRDAFAETDQKREREAQSDERQSDG